MALLLEVDVIDLEIFVVCAQHYILYSRWLHAAHNLMIEDVNMYSLSVALKFIEKCEAKYNISPLKSKNVLIWKACWWQGDNIIIK